MNKKQYVVLVLLALTFVVFFNHRHYFFCKEPEVSGWDEVKIFLNLMVRPEQCSGIQEITKMAVELSVYMASFLVTMPLLQYMCHRFDNWLKNWVERNWLICLAIVFVLIYIWAAFLCIGNTIKKFFFPWTKEQRHVD